jgi:hypothetical protein
MRVPEGFESKAHHAAWLGVTERSIDRYTDQPDGMPFSRFSRWKIFKREWTLAWLEGRKESRNPTPKDRQRGRPPRAAGRRVQHAMEVRSGPLSADAQQLRPGVRNDLKGSKGDATIGPAPPWYKLGEGRDADPPRDAPAPDQLRVSRGRDR